MVMEQQVERAMRTRPEDEVAKSLWRGRVSKAAENAFRACDSAASEWATSANEDREYVRTEAMDPKMMTTAHIKRAFANQSTHSFLSWLRTH